jgi:hypothetical protein
MSWTPYVLPFLFLTFTRLFLAFVGSKRLKYLSDFPKWTPEVAEVLGLDVADSPKTK